MLIVFPAFARSMIGHPSATPEEISSGSTSLGLGPVMMLIVPVALRIVPSVFLFVLASLVKIVPAIHSSIVRLSVSGILALRIAFLVPVSSISLSLYVFLSNLLRCHTAPGYARIIAARWHMARFGVCPRSFHTPHSTCAVRILVIVLGIVVALYIGPALCIRLEFFRTASPQVLFSLQ